jgi:hypothetical protein
MARIRTIKPEFWTSEQIAECSPNARLMFIGLWNFCDDYGRHPASAKRLKMEVFPADSIEVRPLVKELLVAGLIEEYETEGQSFWQVTGWGKHQKIDSPTSKYPDRFGEYSATIRRTSNERSPLEKDKEKDKELEKEKENKARFVKPTIEEIFEYCKDRGNVVDAVSFWNFYEAKGWMVGKNKMKDWRACVVTWERGAATTNGRVNGKDYTP